MAHRGACLVDVYDTILSTDFSAHRTDLPELAGVAPEAFFDAYQRIGPALTVGQVSKAEAYELILRACGVKPRESLMRDLVDKDLELLLATATMYPDAIPFLEMLKASGIKIAIVSNCSEHTRELLTSVGVAALADALVLSCEVGCIKPGARIYRHALDQVGVAAADALFVDDQAVFCAASEMLGMSAAQIVRSEGNGKATTVVKSLLEVETLLR
jgi:putative hydrolase of the HAD superfamily